MIAAALLMLGSLLVVVWLASMEDRRRGHTQTRLYCPHCGHEVQHLEERKRALPVERT